MNRLVAILDLLRKGRRVQNAKDWKNAQLMTGLVVAVGSVLTAFGIHHGMTHEQAGLIALIVISGWETVSMVITLITTRKTGLPEKQEYDLFDHDRDPVWPRADKEDDEGLPPFIDDPWSDSGTDGFPPTRE